MLAVLIITIIVGTLITYILISIIHNDLSVRNLPEIKNKNILVIYPHPDDEVWMSGGLMFNLSKKKDINLFVISVTKGEHGDEVLKLSPEELGKVRSNEYLDVMKILGVKNSELWSFTDGDCPAQESELKLKINEFINDHNIDLVITYEKLGLYGHPDHIVLSKVISEVAKENKIQALYSTLPENILKRIQLPETLTYKDKVVELTLDKISAPQYKLNVMNSTLKRYKAVKTYKSQKTGGGRPLWLAILFSNFEYYTSEYN